MDYLNTAGAAVTVAMGCLGLFFPGRAAIFTGLEAKTVPGRSEFRSTFGGLFVMLGLVPLFTMLPVTFLMLALSWFGAAAGRVLSIFADRAHDLKNWLAVAFEGAIAAMILAGAPFEILLGLLDCF